jgi:hypothetical protein
MRYDRQGKRTISCNQEVHDEELEHHFRSAHGITSEDMVKFYVTKAKTEYCEAKYEN